MQHRIDKQRDVYEGHAARVLRERGAMPFDELLGVMTDEMQEAVHESLVNSERIEYDEENGEYRAIGE